MGGKSSSPPAPDYAGAAQQQGVANKETAITQGHISNPNVINPYGTQTVKWGSDPVFDQAGYDAAMAKYNAGLTTGGAFGWDGSSFGLNGGAPTKEQFTTVQNAEQPTVTQTLAPAQQALLDSQNRISQSLADTGEAGLNRVSQSLATPFDTSNIHPLVADDAARQTSQDAAYRQATSRLDPQWQTAGDRQETQLRNQGLVPGGEAYDNAMRDFNFGKNDAYSSAYNNSFNQGLNAQQVDLGMQTQANQGNLQQQEALRTMPLNEVNALRTGSQVQNPQFQQFQGSQVGQTPIMQAAQNQGAWQQNAYNQQVGSQNSFNTGLMGIGAATASQWGPALAAMF